MDASRSLQIARRRFQNGNYLLSIKKYTAARKEFEVALAIFEKTDAYRETAEALNNIGITHVKENEPEAAKGFFESSYELKKVHDESGEALFNSLYNIIGLGPALTPEEFEKYYAEVLALGESLGGEFADIAKREKATYDHFIEAKEAERKKLEEAELARTSPEGALSDLEKQGKPCLITLRFALQGITVTVPEFSYKDGKTGVKLAGIIPGEGMSTGEIEFDADYESVREFLENKEEPALLEEAFEHVKKFMEAVALVREDIDYCVGKRGYSALSITLMNAYGEPLELYHANAVAPVAASLSSEDTMLVNMMLTAQHGLYRMLLLNAKRSMAEENHTLCVVDAVAGFEAFMDLLLKKALPDAERKDYLAMENPCLRERLRFLKRLVGGTDTSASLEHYLGDVGRDMDDVLAYYDTIMSNDGHTIGAYEARKSLSAVNRAIYNLKALYEI